MAGTSRTFQGAEHCPVGLAFAHGDLISAEDRQSVQGSFGLHFSHSLFVDVLDRMSMQRLKDAHRFIRHDLAQLRDQHGQLASHLGTSYLDEVQGFRTDSTGGATHSITFETKKTQVLPQGQMLDLLPVVIVTGGCLATFATAVIPFASFQMHDHGAMFLSNSLPFQPDNAKPLNSQQRRETISWHLMRPPRVMYEKSTVSDASIFQLFFTHSIVP